MPPPPRIRPYKDFLTPALHRRFARATAALFALCYAEAVYVGEWNSFIWTWFPLGRAGIRAGLLFIPAFMIFILRVAQLHVGFRTSYSAYQTFTRYAARLETVQTAMWYLLSAYLFSEIYIWSAPPEADLNRIKQPHWTDRRVLNEKPIYLTSYLIFVALLQTGIHLFYDYDKIDMPATKATPEAPSEQVETSNIPPYVQLKTRIPALVTNALSRAIGMAVISPFIYSLTIRSFAWSFTRSFAKIFWNLPKSSALPATRPFHWSVLARTVAAGFLLVMLWEVGNAAFSAYVAQAPLKNDRPITYESKDPNGSLLTGLKGKKLQTRAFAFWELVYIAKRFQGRRKMIFEDIDRKGGAAWSQILAVCIEVIKGIETRIAEFQAPPVAMKQGKEETITPLPRLSQPLKDGLKQSGDIFTAPNTKNKGVAQAVGSYAKAHGQSPPGSSPNTKKLLARAESAVLTPEQRKEIDANGVTGLFKERALRFIQSSFGWPFRQEYRRRISAVVLGSPYGDVGIIVDAIESLTRFAVCSLSEDKYGNVQRDVKLIIQTLTASVTKLEAFKISLPFHWTDVEKKRESPEVDTILAALKAGLTELIEAFGNYSEDLRLSQSEMRLAREAATPARVGREMAEIGK